MAYFDKNKIGEIRPNQLITTFGPGAIVDAVKDSVTVLDTNYWTSKGKKIIDGRLAAYLGVSYFYMPQTSKKGDLPVVSFPNYHVCSDPRCGRLFDVRDNFDEERYKIYGPTCPICHRIAYPSRFIVMCEKGHMDDFPWDWWIHKGKTTGHKNFKLYSTGYTSTLADMWVECLDCGEKRSLSGAMQEDAFKSNLPLGEDNIRKVHTFDRRSMATVFPFINSEVGHENGIPIGFNRQTGLPILYDNFSPSLSNYNMVIFGKSGAGKGVTIKTLIARSTVLMGIESLALDAEGEYGVVAEALGGLNVVISPSSNTVINPFDIEPEITRDEITGRERVTLNVENKVEDVTQILLTMARGSTRTENVNEVTKQIIAEASAEEYASLGITNDVNSLYERNINGVVQNIYLGKTKKKMPTIGSWYKRLLTNANKNTNPDYRVHYSYLVKVMKQYVRELNGQMAYFDGQSTFDLLDGTSFINLDISNLEERFARPLAQQILLSWIWEKYVKKNSEDKTKAGKKRVIVDEAWMLLPYPEAVDFLNKMARRARKRNVSLAVVSQRFQDFYEKSEVQAVLTSSDTKLFLAQDKSEIQYIKEVFKLSEGEASFLTTCSRGQGLFKVEEQTAIMEIVPTKKEFEFIETNINKLKEQQA